MNAPRLVSLQFLRAFAAVLVAMYHFQPHWNLVAPDTTGPDLSWFGFWGIDVFFVVSGFVMWWTTASPGTAAPGVFFVKRLLRIYPTYWLVIGLVCLLHRTSPVNPLETVLLLPQPLHQMPLPVAWTLTYEIFFYVAFAALLAFFPDTRTRRYVVVGVLGTLCLVGIALWLLGDWTRDGHQTLRVALGFSLWSELLQVGWSPYQIEFFAGALVASRFVEERGRSWTPSPLVAAATVAALLAAAILLSIRIFGEHLNKGHFVFQHVLLFGTPAVLAVCFLCQQERACEQFARGRLGRVCLWLGDGSYSIYLLHTVLFDTAYRLGIREAAAGSGLPGAIAFLLVLPVTIGLSAAFGNRVELPLYRVLAKRWVPR